MKVEQFKHANQFHIWSENDNIQEDELQSYNSLVVSITTIKENGKKIITLGCDWDYSKTTSAHVYDFLEEYGNVYFTRNNTKKQQVYNMIEQNKIQYDENMR